MVRYENQPLPMRPRIAVIANDAIGNFVMATPLFQLLRQERRPASIDYFGGTRTRELQERSDLFERSHLLHGATSAEVCSMLKLSGSFDLVVNLESTALAKTAAGLLAGDSGLVSGPCIGAGGRGDMAFGTDSRGDLWRDREWARANLTEDYPFLKSGFIAEIFARLCYLEGELPKYRVPAAEPEIEVPDVLIATAASLPEKLWPISNWVELVKRFVSAGLRVGLLGAPPREQSAHWKGAEDEATLVQDGLSEDLRGKLSLPQVVGALAKAKVVVTLDNGILHLAAAEEAPTVGIYRHGIHHLWAPPAKRLAVLTPGEGREVPSLTVDEVWRRVEFSVA